MLTYDMWLYINDTKLTTAQPVSNESHHSSTTIVKVLITIIRLTFMMTQMLKVVRSPLPFRGLVVWGDARPEQIPKMVNLFK